MRVISLSSRPAWRAAAARGLRSAAGSASRARLAAQNRPALRLPSALAGDPAGQVAQILAGGRARLGPGDLPLRFQQRGDRGPVQAAVGLHRPDEPVGLAVDLGRRGQDVAAAGAEVQVMGGQVAVVLGRTPEVGVQPAAGGAHVRGHTVEQASIRQRGERGVPVAGRAMVVDVQDVGSGRAGGDGHVPVQVAGEPRGDLILIGGGVAVAVRGGGGLLVGLAGEYRPAAGRVGQRPAKHRVGHGLLQGWPTAGAGLRGWPQRLVSIRSCSARMGRMRAWYSD